MERIEFFDGTPRVFSAMRIDVLVGKDARKVLLETFFSLFVLALIWWAVVSYTLMNMVITRSRALGIVLIFFGLFLASSLIEFGYAAALVPGKVFKRGVKEYIFSVEALWLLGSDGNIYSHLIDGQFGQFVSLRLGFPYEVLENFCKTKDAPPDLLKNTADLADRKKSTSVRVPDFFEVLYETDKSFADLIFSLQIKKEELLGGERIEVGDEVLDNTYRRKLQELEKFLKQEK